MPKPVEPKPLTHAQAVTRSRKANAMRAVNIQLAPDDSDRLDRLAMAHGGIKAAVVAGLRALEGRGEMSKAELLAEIERRLR